MSWTQVGQRTNGTLDWGYEPLADSGEVSGCSDCTVYEVETATHCWGKSGCSSWNSCPYTMADAKAWIETNEINHNWITRVWWYKETYGSWTTTEPSYSSCTQYQGVVKAVYTWRQADQ